MRHRQDVAQPPPLTAWPAAPEAMTAEEQAKWTELGEALVSRGTASSGDEHLVAIAARVLVRLDAALGGEAGALKVSTVNSLARLAADLLQRLGLTPQGRGTVSKLPAPRQRDPRFEEFRRPDME